MGATQSAASGFSPTHPGCSPQVKGPVRLSPMTDTGGNAWIFPDAEAVAAGAAAIHVTALLPRRRLLRILRFESALGRAGQMRQRWVP